MSPQEQSDLLLSKQRCASVYVHKSFKQCQLLTTGWQNVNVEFMPNVKKR